MFCLLKGFCAGGSLIVAIGTQNLYVLRQGISKQHLFPTALLCASLDALLIFLGLFGVGEVILLYPLLLDIVTFFAVAFLLFYGGVAMRNALKRGPKTLSDTLPSTNTLKRTLLTLLAISLLNPHVYLDTVILLGSVAAKQPEEEQLFFAAGAICASFIWFFSLTYGARFLAPLFQKETSLRIMDGAIAVTLWAIALSLLL